MRDMAAYYVNNRAQSNGDHEVHVASCIFFPSDRKYLGEFSSCQPAVETAKQYYRQSNGCFTCCRACHTS